MSRSHRSGRHLPLLVAALSLTVLTGALATPARAAEPATESLAMVPQDASFYMSALRLREQFDMVANSNWWKRLNEWEMMQQMRTMAMFGLQQPGSPMAEIQQWMEQPENQQLVEVLRDMVSDEIFVYGDAQVSDTLALAVEVMNAVRYGPMFYEVVGRSSGLSDEEFMAKWVMDMLVEDVDRIKTPSMVIGFKLKKAGPAEEQLRRLEAIVRVVLENEEDLAPIKDKFERTKVGKSEFLTLSLDGSLVPWDEIPFAELEDEPGQYDALKKKFSEMTLVVSIGIHNNYALISIGESNDHLAQLGSGKVLADHPKLAPLRAKGSLPYTDVAYVSETFMKTVGTKPEDIDDLVDVAKELLPLAELAAEDEQAIIADVKELANDVKPMIPQLGAQLVFTYLTDRGYEGYSYNWSENKTWDGSQPLTLMNHLGGTPMMAFLARSQHRPENYDLLVKWMRKGRDYFERFAVPEMSPGDRQQYEVVAQIAYPLLARIDDINRNKMIPALAEGQSALVMDNSLKSKQWLANLPPTIEPIAIPSPAIVLGLKDAKLFKEALTAYREVFNDAMAKARELSPEVPDFELPPAKVREMNDGTEVYYYTLPAEFGVFDRVAPNLAVNDKFVVMSMVPRHTVQVVKPKKLEVEGGPLTGSDSRPLAAAFYFNCSSMVDMMTPWVNEGVRAYVRAMEQAFGGFGNGPGFQFQGDSDMAKQILSQVKQGAEFLKVFRSYSSVTYVEDDALVTHSETHIKDLD